MSNSKGCSSLDLISICHSLTLSERKCFGREIVLIVTKLDQIKEIQVMENKKSRGHCHLCFTREGIFRRIYNTDAEAENPRGIPHLVEKHLQVQVHEKIDRYLSEEQHDVSNIKTEPLDDPLAENSGDSYTDSSFLEDRQQQYNTDLLSLVKTEPEVLIPQDDIIGEDEDVAEESQLANRITIKVEPREPQYESDNDLDASSHPLWKESSSNIKLENIPKTLIVNGRLVVKGTQLRSLVNNFYDLECKICQDKHKYKSLWILFHHYSRDHKQKGYVVCCSKTMKTQNTAIMHMVRHLQPDAFKCDICGYHVARPEFLENHKKTHLPNAEKPFRCNQCSQGFCWQNALKMHQMTYHPKDNNKPTFTCHLCERVFMRKDALKDHMRNIHEPQEERPKVQCPHCFKWFNSQKYLKRHMITHTIRYPNIENSILP